MIIFYNRLTGNIVGSISGDKHFKEERNFWVGEKSLIDRVIYDSSAPYYDNIKHDPLFAKKYKINLDTLFLQLK